MFTDTRQEHFCGYTPGTYHEIQLWRKEGADRNSPLSELSVHTQNCLETKSKREVQWCSVDKLCPTLGTPWAVARQAPRSLGFSRRDYWSGLPFSSSRELPDPGIKPRFPALQADSLLTELCEKLKCDIMDSYSTLKLQSTTLLSKINLMKNPRLIFCV